MKVGLLFFSFIFNLIIYLFIIKVCIQITKFTNNARFAFDTYKRFLQMFGNTVLGIENYIYDEIVQNVRTRRGTSNDEALTLSDLQRIVNEFKAVAYVPENVFDQLHMCIEGIFRAWFTPKAYIYRNLNNIPISLGNFILYPITLFLFLPLLS